MNSSQKEVQQAQLDAEKKVIRQLKQVYNQAIKDCESKIAVLNSRTDMQNVQSIIYQEQYQQALKSQLEAIMTSLQANEYQTISDYLTDSYTNGYTGAMYTVQKQTGCAVVTPINQSQVVKALQTDSKLSKSLYSKLGEDISYLKKSIKAELSRGIANGSSWLEMASKIAKGMNSPYKKAINNAIRIARTEGHRIQQQSHLDALYAAEEEGADIVKQWDSTLDSRTRPDHRAADGQIRELDEKFRVGGEDMEAPGVGGSARNVCNCRCCLLQRAKWALDEDELATLKSRAAYYGLDKTADFEDFKSKYLNYQKAAQTVASVVEETVYDDSGSIIDYVSGEKMYINQDLRNGTVSSSDKEFVEALDRVTSETVTETKLYRAVDASAVFGNLSQSQYEDIRQELMYKAYSSAKGEYSQKKAEEINSLLDSTIGKTITDKGYMSTTTDEEVALYWGDFTGSDMSITLDFDVESGVKGKNLEAFDVEGNEQKEVLLARNQSYTVTGITVKEGTIVVKAKLHS